MFDSYSVKVDMKATGRKIRELRIRNKLKVEEFAEIMHSSQNTIFKWQRGECLPTIDNLLVLSSLFDTPMDDIIQREGRGDEPLLPVLHDKNVRRSLCFYERTVDGQRGNLALELFSLLDLGK
ncbi:MAG: helix-turn-helix transcriptional regulator [Butyrivibrio sp.]|nr:helix-turn-helix transcriptional regulator [Butyrivibrio sp.]